MLALLNWRIWAAVALAVFLAGTHWKAYRMGESTVQAKWDKESLEVARQSLKLSEEATRTTVSLEDNAAKLREDKDEQISKLSAALDSNIERLRNRPERPSKGDMSKTPGTGSACSGASLYRQDAEFLIRESTRADAYRVQLAECQATYSAARKALE